MLHILDFLPSKLRSTSHWSLYRSSHFNNCF